MLSDEAGQLLDVVAMLVADQNRVDVRYREPDGGERTLQPPHANTTVDQQDGFRRPHQDRVPGASAAETRYCEQSGISGSDSHRLPSAYFVQGTLTAARQ